MLLPLWPRRDNVRVRPDITWEDRHGVLAHIKVDSVGLRVGLNGHISPDLTDVHELEKLYDAIGDHLVQRGHF